MTSPSEAVSYLRKMIFKECLKNDSKKAQFFRFAIIGIVAFILHYAIYCICFRFVSEGIAYTIGYVLSFFCNFYLSSRFTFHSKATTLKGVGFAGAHAVNYFNHIVLLHLFLWLGISRVWAPIPVNCIAVPINFVLVRFVFKH